ncbi:CHAP domain-containing protein [Nonomuraea sp. NPDC050556]|uniref:CHAP domain-containing protein n=1 Tax=Nonomuraea sp. NPDC050556 TaxID=3364369 RepID=UPI0037B3072F
MTPEMQKFIDLLESQLGYSEKGDAYTKFGDWYGKNVEFDADYSSAPWCDMYLSWAAHKLGYEDWIGQFAWTVAHAEWFKENDAWGTKPKPGAFVFYDWGGSNDVDEIDHVGIVTKVEGDKIFTIEGNIDGGVAKRKERDTSKVVGYGYPEQIKARLDEVALKEAAKQAEEAAPDVQVGEVEQAEPEQPEVSDFIPESGSGEQHQGPVIVKTTKPVKPKQATASPAPTPRKGKHAKPATADTNAVTQTGPLPVITTASAPIGAPSLSSPALVGTALVAALAVLAVAKTRQLRVRLAPAARTAAPAPTGGRRRKRRPTLTPVEPMAAGLKTIEAPLLAAPVADAPLDLARTTPLEVTAATLRQEAHEAAAALERGASFDAFTPAGRRATNEAFDEMVAGVRESFDALEQGMLDERAYRGRRRLREHPAEATFSHDTRGQRHRTHEPAFTQDAPLRGRRHRPQPELAGVSAGAQQEPPRRRTTNRGRHRA